MSVSESKKSGRPTYREIICDAIKVLDERGGSSRIAIKKYIVTNNERVKTHAAFPAQFARQLKNSVEEGILLQTGQSFRLSPTYKRGLASIELKKKKKEEKKLEAKESKENGTTVKRKTKAKTKLQKAKSKSKGKGKAKETEKIRKPLRPIQKWIVTELLECKSYACLMSELFEHVCKKNKVLVRDRARFQSSFNSVITKGNTNSIWEKITMASESKGDDEKKYDDEEESMITLTAETVAKINDKKNNKRGRKKKLTETETDSGKSNSDNKDSTEDDENTESEAEEDDTSETTDKPSNSIISRPSSAPEANNEKEISSKSTTSTTSTTSAIVVD